MSTRFTLWCDTCEVPGPHVRRHHRTAILMQEATPRFFPVNKEDAAADEWGRFLIEHEYCDLRLRYEYNPNRAPDPPAREPTHELMADGSLRPLS